MERLFKLSKSEQALVQFILLAWAVVVLFPFALAILNSLKPSVGAVYRNPFALPEVWQFSNYADAWIKADFARYFLNSVIIAAGSVILVLFCASTTAFVLARMPFKGSTLIFIAFLIGVIVPIRLALAPLVTIVRFLNLDNNLLGLILIQSASMMPIAVFILTAFLQKIPKDLEEAAMIDGALPFRIYAQVILPLVRPALATIALLTFVQAWNEFFFPLIFLRDAQLFPLTLGITEFRKAFSVQWHLMFAGIIIMLVPTILAFLLASKHFIAGLAQGGVKE